MLNFEHFILKEHEKYFGLTSHHNRNPPTTSIWVFCEDVGVGGGRKRRRGEVRKERKESCLYTKRKRGSEALGRKM